MWYSYPRDKRNKEKEYIHVVDSRLLILAVLFSFAFIIIIFFPFSCALSSCYCCSNNVVLGFV